jgi:hypothetical protein
MGLLLHLVILVLALAFPSYFLFPLGLTYLTFGLLLHAVQLVMERHDHVPMTVVDTGEVEEDVRRTAPRMTGYKRSSEERTGGGGDR